ncbi:MAG TPA: hypothetical protein DEV93_21640 [Chloroflexi bacterium]|jgi:hypothetical protein|nr:hypothetical protein [Chloroflexota bacterium]
MSRRRVLAAGWLLLLGLSATLPLSALFHGVIRIGPGTLVAARPLDSPVISLGSSVTLPRGSRSVVVVIGGDIRSDGVAKDDLITVGGNVYLGPSARVNADVLSMVGTVYKSSQTRVAGRIGGPLRSWDGRSVRHRDLLQTLFNSIRLGLAAGLALLLVGACLTVVFPWQIVLISSTLRASPLKSVGAGLACLVAFVFLVVPLGLSLAGLPFALLLSGAAFLAWLFGMAAAAVLVGRAAARGSVPLLWATAAGLVILALVMAIPVVGPLSVSLAGLTGAGALAVALVGRAGPATPLS